jgi:glycosyltransferase involved in cell wall biosynthesis
MNIIRISRDAIRTLHQTSNEVRQLADTAARLEITVKALEESVRSKATTAARLQEAINELDVALVKSSGLFDSEWYLKKYPDVSATGGGPLEHYLEMGWREGRNPGPLFFTDIYLEQHPTVREAGINPLVHHLRSVGTFHENKRIDVDWQFLQSNNAAAAQTSNQPLKTRSPGQRASSEIGSTAVPQTLTQIAKSNGKPSDTRPLKLLIVSYGSYDNNSAIQITGLANGLISLGYDVVVSAIGDVRSAGDFGLPRFRCVPHKAILQNPASLTEAFAGSGEGPDLIHCWTPREAVREVASAVIERFQCPYIVHFEDNEAAIDEAYRGATATVASEDPDPAPRSELQIPEPMREFVAGAVGATVIVDALRTFLPDELPIQLFEPGVDLKWFAPVLGAEERARLCQALGVPSDAWIVVYPGNIHPANAEEMFSLYAAIHALNARGYKVHLIRTGIDSLAAPDSRFVELTKQYVTSLGLVRRDWLLELLRLADLFVQPGAPDSFNNYRLPSKIPEFLAVGRSLVLPATNVGLLMRHGEDALLMERGDAEEITACVAKLLDDPAFSDRLACNGRRFAVEHFDWAKTVTVINDFYRIVLGRHVSAIPAQMS